MDKNSSLCKDSSCNAQTYQFGSNNTAVMRQVIRVLMERGSWGCDRFTEID